MTTFTQTQVFNKTSNMIGIVYGDGFDQALQDTDPRLKDVIEVRQVTIELVKQGQKRISGSNTFEDRMVQKVIATKVTETGTVKKVSGQIVVIWQ